MQTKTIYDFGANNGDDIPYYLLKADRVIAIEANPELCQQIRTRFSSEITAGRLIVESCVLSATDTSKDVSFYIHKSKSVRSQFPRPSSNNIADFNEVLLPSKTVTQIIEAYGEPYYIKIDIEHYDAKILRDMLSNNIFPPLVSAESHTIDVFCMLVIMGYKAFKLVDGASISSTYANRVIENQTYTFPHHSSGPFGNDIDGEWMTADNFMRLLAFEGLGWKDIHASGLDTPDPSLIPSLKEKYHAELSLKIKRKLTRTASKFNLIKRFNNRNRIG